MAAVVQDAVGLQLGMHTHKTVSRMTSALTLRMPVGDQAYDAAIDDTLFGVTSGCSQTNPTEQIQKPVSSPVCQ
ncbi:unnamed protein product [Penicillium manginii]